jgi:hypothetical protein
VTLSLCIDVCRSWAKTKRRARRMRRKRRRRRRCTGRGRRGRGRSEIQRGTSIGPHEKTVSTRYRKVSYNVSVSFRMRIGDIDVTEL